jgi:hypothetical protein
MIMGLFDKKYCDICGEKIKLLGNRKLDDGNMCKTCADKLSPFTTDRKKTGLAEIKEHLAYREANKQEVAKFSVTRTFGYKTKVMLDENAGKFIVTSAINWQSENPDIILLSQVTGCRLDIRELKTEMKYKNGEGKNVSYVPARYDFNYDFHIIISVNSPWFSEIEFRLNKDQNIDQRGSHNYNEHARLADEIRAALTKAR